MTTKPLGVDFFSKFFRQPSRIITMALLRFRLVYLTKIYRFYLLFIAGISLLALSSRVQFFNFTFRLRVSYCTTVCNFLTDWYDLFDFFSPPTSQTNGINVPGASKALETGGHYDGSVESNQRQFTDTLMFGKDVYLISSQGKRIFYYQIFHYQTSAKAIDMRQISSENSMILAWFTVF